MMRCPPRLPKPYPGSRVCFASGAQFAREAGGAHRLVITYGAGDAEARVWSVPWEPVAVFGPDSAESLPYEDFELSFDKDDEAPPV